MVIDDDNMSVGMPPAVDVVAVVAFVVVGNSHEGEDTETPRA